jgi:TonB family protein
MPLILLSAALAGCGSPGQPLENPVTNQPPELKPGVFSIAAVDVRPVATHEVEAEYPPELGSILTGKAVVVFTVRIDGKVTDASVLQADDVLFGESAVAAVVKWRFQPAQLHGAPVACRVTLPFVFTSPFGVLSGEGGGFPDHDTPPSGSEHTSLEPH